MSAGSRRCRPVPSLTHAGRFPQPGRELHPARSTVRAMGRTLEATTGLCRQSGGLAKEKGPDSLAVDLLPGTNLSS